MVIKKDRGLWSWRGKQHRRKKMQVRNFGFPGSHSKTGPCWSLSLSREHKMKERRRKKKREIPACNLHQPRTRRPGCAPRRPAVPLVYTHDGFSLVQFGLDPIIRSQLCSLLQGAQPRPPTRVWKLRSSHTAACHAE